MQTYDDIILNNQTVMPLARYSNCPASKLSPWWFMLLAGFISTPALASLSEEPLPTSVLKNRPAQLRLTYEQVDISSSETMGLGGLSYLVNISPSIYAGLSAYGALSGQRGGFFTGGLEVGTGMRYGQVLVDAGLFVGGGGGGSAPQGSGLMVRPHIGVSRLFNDFSLGAGLSWVKFPDGNIDSKQVYLNLGIPLDVVYADSRYTGMSLDAKEVAGYGLRKGHSRLVAKAERYIPASGVLTTAGGAMSAMDTLGFEYQYDLSSGWFGLLEVAGAGQGSSDGYAEVLFGAGWGMPILDGQTRFNLSTSLGGAGGGSVDTGGGVIAKVGIGIEHQFSPRLSAGVELGKVTSQGQFEGSRVALNLSYALGELNPTRHGHAVDPEDSVVLQGWEVAASHQSYFKAQRKSGPEQGINLVGMKLARQLGKHTYVTGQAYGAYQGGAGGYAVGLMGAGMVYPLGSSPWSISLEALLGVGGGGGLDVSGGSLAQIQAGLLYRVSRSLAVQLELGAVKSLTGDLDSGIANINLVYSFSRPELRYPDPR